MWCAVVCVRDPCVCAAPRNHRPCRHDATHSALVVSFSRARAAVVKNNRTGAPEFRCAPAHPPDRAVRTGTHPSSAAPPLDRVSPVVAAALAPLALPSSRDTPRNDAHGPATRDLTLAQRGARCAGGRQQCGPASRCCRHPLLTSRSPAASRRRRLAASRRARQTQSARCWRRRTSSCPTLAAARASHRRATPSL